MFQNGFRSLRSWLVEKYKRETFSKHLQYQVGDGSRVKLWHDLWCRDTILKKSYPKLFGISCNKDSSIANVQFHNGITGFAIFETCAILGVRIFVKFYGFNSFLPGWRNGEDELCWKLDKSRGFEMGGYYISLVSTTAVSFPWKIIWKWKVPPRVAFFS